jgi:peptidase E
MTKFILLGGYLAKAQDGGKSFAEELVKDHGDVPKVLMCLFARPRETWADAYAKECVAINSYISNKVAEFQLAEPETFVDQVRWADAIYLRGGITSALIDTLKQHMEWLDEFDGKTVAGSSAGADALATHHYNLDLQECGSGLGVLPVKVIPHWRSNYGDGTIDWDAAYAILNAYGKDLPILTLAEGEFVVRTQRSCGDKKIFLKKCAYNGQIDAR